MNTSLSTSYPVIWIFSTGTEILQGASVDRNSPWLSARLQELGFVTQRHIAIADNPQQLREALAEAAQRADLVITTGGLGPTADDLNRQVIADAWGTQLEEDARALEMIEERFRRRGRSLTPQNRVQALIPREAVTLYNDHGTAPGFYIRSVAGGPRARLLALPGPPREMAPMFDASAADLILADFAGERKQVRTALFHTCCIPESEINQHIEDLFDSDPRVIVALLAQLSHVDIRLTFISGDTVENERLETQWRKIIGERIGAQNIYAEGDEHLEHIIGRLLLKRGETIVTSESCTGGRLAGQITEAPGSSDYFREGFVTYANEAKMARMGVRPDLLARHGAVSEPVAQAMALGAREVAGTDWAVSITGIAGPTGGTPEKPVGTVCFGLVGPDGEVHTAHHVFLGNREEVRRQAVITALDMVRRGLLEAPLWPQMPGIELKKQE